MRIVIGGLPASPISKARCVSAVRCQNKPIDDDRNGIQIPFRAYCERFQRFNGSKRQERPTGGTGAVRIGRRGGGDRRWRRCATGAAVLRVTSRRNARSGARSGCDLASASGRPSDLTFVTFVRRRWNVGDSSCGRRGVEEVSERNMTGHAAADKSLDLIAIGRSSVDLYGQQIGCRLEDVASFAKSVGGCPANIAIGTARLGLKSALITRVGAEQMGGFIREQLVREGVDVDGVHADKDRLSRLVLLAVKAEGVSPTIFYRADCADMALDESDIDEALIARARAIVVTGTHFSKPNAAAAQTKAIALAKRRNAKVVFDIDYRPNLWGLAGHEAGFERYVKSEAVSTRLSAVLVDCDLIVGTEEEVMIAAGADTSSTRCAPSARNPAPPSS